MGPNVGIPTASRINQRTAILDSNLLLLHISAQVGLRHFKSFGRLSSFRQDDVPLLQRTLDRFPSVKTTSYILAEVSNLANKLSGSLRDRWFQQLSRFAVVTSETHVNTQVVGARPELVRFGVTDSALCHLAQTHIVITAEFRLAGYLQSKGHPVINFNHLRRFS